MQIRPVLTQVPTAASRPPCETVPHEPTDTAHLGGGTSITTPSAPTRSAAPLPLRAAYDALYNAGGEGRTRLLEDNAKAWNARWRVVESAQKQITTQYFCWDHDVFGLAFLGHIYKKVKDGQVSARLMVDATGDTFGTRGFKSHIGGRDYLQEVVATGHADAKVYHPHYKKVIDQLLHPSRAYIAASNHDKILEVDGERGITGGRNIGYEYYAHPGDFKGAWRDTDVEFESAAAAHALRGAFDVEYGAPWINEKVKPDAFGNWVKRDLELLGAYAMMDIWLKAARFTPDEKSALRASDERRAAQAETLLQQVIRRLPSEGMQREPNKREHKNLARLAAELVRYPELRGSYNDAQPTQHDGEIKILDKTSAVGTEQDQINGSLARLAASAQKRIVIENPYIVLTEDMRKVLKDAGDRGVEIWLGTNSPSSTDSDVTQAFFLEDWPKLLATIPNLKIFVASGERKLHAKVGVIDDQATVVSSFNLDFLSSKVNSEVAAVIWSPTFAAETFDGIMRDHADPQNGAVEYTIRRDSSGTPTRSDGKPVLDAQGNLQNDPEVTFGPDDHVTPELMQAYKKKRARWKWIRDHIPQFDALRKRFGSEPKKA